MQVFCFKAKLPVNFGDLRVRRKASPSNHRLAIKLPQIFILCQTGFVTLTEAAVIFLWTSFLRASGSRHDIPFCLCLFSEFSECVSGDEVASVIEEIVDLTMS